MRYKEELKEELEEFWESDEEEGILPEEILETTPEQMEQQRIEARHTLYSLYAGIVFLGLLFLLGGSLLLKGNPTYVAGLLLGMAVAAGMAAHMYHTIKKAVDLPENGAAGYTKKSALLRMLFIIAALLIAALLPQYFHFAGVMLGVLTLKGAALLYPVTNKLLFHKGG